MAVISPSNMTSATAPAPYVVTESSYYNDPSYGGFCCFDGGANYWLTAASASGWVAIDLGSSASYILNTYDVRVNTVPEATRAPKNWTMEGSNDGTNWTTIDTVTNQTAWGNGENRSFTCDTQTTGYRRFRINITANNGDTYLQIMTLTLNGTAATSSAQPAIFMGCNF